MFVLVRCGEVDIIFIFLYIYILLIGVRILVFVEELNIWENDIRIYFWFCGVFLGIFFKDERFRIWSDICISLLCSIVILGILEVL